MIYKDLHSIEYGTAWEYQQALFDKAVAFKNKGASVDSHLLFCEHPHTITMGKNGQMENILFNEQGLKEKGVALFKIDRGGDVTYHGPGQLVGYPIFDLEAFDIGLRAYITKLEEVIIRCLSVYGVQAERLANAAGVWIDAKYPALTRKICAIGVRSSRFVTMHGFALNVNTDLSYFSLINPCGFIDKGVTSLQKELGREVDMQELKDRLKILFEAEFIERTQK